MSNFLKRLTLTLVGIPLIFLVIFWPQKSHILAILAFGIVITFFGSYEIGSLIFKKGINVRRFFLPVINLFILSFAYIYANNYFNIQEFKPVWVLFLFLLIAILSFIYARDISKKDLSRSFEKMAYTLLGILYIGVPSFFIPFLFNIETTPTKFDPVFYNVGSTGTLTGSFLVLFMLVNIFSSDIFSYVFGMLFGRTNVINLEASPKKSWAGYIGGYLSNYFWVALFYILFDRVFKLIDFPWWFYFTVPLFSGIIIPIGDLVESVIKRSANVKDSGDIMPGRGGILDSVDTILYFIPIYFIYIQIYFAFTSL